MSAICSRCLMPFERIPTRTITLPEVTVRVFLIGCACRICDADYVTSYAPGSDAHTRAVRLNRTTRGKKKPAVVRYNRKRVVTTFSILGK